MRALAAIGGSLGFASGLAGSVTEPRRCCAPACVPLLAARPQRECCGHRSVSPLLPSARQPAQNPKTQSKKAQSVTWWWTRESGSGKHAERQRQQPRTFFVAAAAPPTASVLIFPGALAIPDQPHDTPTQADNVITHSGNTRNTAAVGANPSMPRTTHRRASPVFLVLPRKSSKRDRPLLARHYCRQVFRLVKLARVVLPFGINRVFNPHRPP